MIGPSQLGKGPFFPVCIAAVFLDPQHLSRQWIEGFLDTATGILPAEQPMRHKNWARWWFHVLIFFHPYLGKMNPIWRAYFSNGLVQPPPSGTKSWGLKSACDTACHAVCSSTTGLPRKKPPTWVFGYRVFLYLAEALREQPHKTGGILGIPSGQFHVEKTRWMFF